VDIFRTPHLNKEIQDGKKYLRVGKKFSLQTKNKVFHTSLLFYCTMGLFCFYLIKIFLDWFIKVTPMCINTGDFGLPAVCYTHSSENQINCTTWNEHLEELKESEGDLLCFSIYYNLLTSLAEIAGLYGLQTIIMLITLPFGVWLSSKHCCCTMFTVIICGISPTLMLVPILVQTVSLENSKLSLGIFRKQFPTLQTVTLCIQLIAALLYARISLKDIIGTESPKECTTGPNRIKSKDKQLCERRVQYWEAIV
jgi:hypothetical protein